ncbi:hypothetical protein GCM10009844_03080 [Nocardioides koreensis]|uniref:AB hydrolase-1 domain-containing protein n=1 Tax=Nocardioides koreensis TaxID=433651 RepID=A0ABP5KVE7_9ACTN
MPILRVLVLLVLCAVLGACSGSDQPTSGGTAGGPEPAADLAQRCGTAIPSDAEARALVLDGPDGARLSAAAFGPERARTALVLLHQTGPGGLCGWGRFASRAAEQGLAVVAIDMCGYGDSACPPGLERDPRGQVESAAAYARDTVGARRVVLVGASMGGSNTVIAVSDGAPVDAWVDVSGVSTWDGVRLQSRAAALRDASPGMIVYARSDGPLEYAAARRLARTSGTPFLDGGSGHGYELMADYRGRLLPAGRAVIDFAQG